MVQPRVLVVGIYTYYPAMTLLGWYIEGGPREMHCDARKASIHRGPAAIGNGGWANTWEMRRKCGGNAGTATKLNTILKHIEVYHHKHKSLSFLMKPRKT
jgi:hypothetical protein